MSRRQRIPKQCLGNAESAEVTIPKQGLGIRPSVTRLSTAGTRNIPHCHNDAEYLPGHPTSSVVNAIRKSSTELIE
jgi:hypothetical protein